LSSQVSATAPFKVVLESSTGTSGALPGEVWSDEHATERASKTGPHQFRIRFSKEGYLETRQIACQATGKELQYGGQVDEFENKGLLRLEMSFSPAGRTTLLPRKPVPWRTTDLSPEGDN
jgi:hypothetical protein